MINPLNIPKEVKQHPDFNKNTRKFFGVDQNDTESNWGRNISKFYDVPPGNV